MAQGGAARRRPLRLLVLAAALACHHAPATTAARPTRSPVVQPNDNRVPAGTLHDGVLTIELDAVVAGWRPDNDVDSLVYVQVFAERGKPPQIPGPLIRVPEGTEVRAIVRNLIADSAVTIYGLSGNRSRGDTVRVEPGAARELRFRATTPGTFMYRGLTKGFGTLVPRRDMTLGGALIVDPRGARPDPKEEIFVISLIDDYPDSALGSKNDVWELAINGRSWPHTKRFRYAVGDTVRWRWVNASERVHPMHLHGFHFTVLSNGVDGSDSIYTPATRRLAVTETMTAGSTFSMEWVPTRAGNWLMHCHMIGHIKPYPERPASARGHDVHNLMRHPEQAMAGLVMAVEVTGTRRDDPASARGGAHHRLLVQETRPDTHGVRRSYILQRGREPRADSVQIPGSPLVVTRGQTTSVTIVNRLTEPTSVHWHGIEIEGVFDGVPGYSGIGRNRSPLIVPGDSFTVWFTPPRAGTYMYHTHMDEEDQLRAGLYAPLIVLEPGERFDPATDIVLMLGVGHDSAGARVPAVNGRAEPPPVSVRAGTRHRLRLANLLPSAPTRVSFNDGTALLSWRPISKDGADLPPARQALVPAFINRLGVGEAYDMEWIPAAGQRAAITFDVFEAGKVSRTTTVRFVVADR